MKKPFADPGGDFCGEVGPEQVADDVGIGDAAIVLCPAGDVLGEVSPEQVVNDDAGVGDVWRAPQAYWR